MLMKSRSAIGGWRDWYWGDGGTVMRERDRVALILRQDGQEGVRIFEGLVKMITVIENKRALTYQVACHVQVLGEIDEELGEGPVIRFGGTGKRKLNVHNVEQALPGIWEVHHVDFAHGVPMTLKELKETSERYGFTPYIQAKWGKSSLVKGCCIKPDLSHIFNVVMTGIDEKHPLHRFTHPAFDGRPSDKTRMVVMDEKGRVPSLEYWGETVEKGAKWELVMPTMDNLREQLRGKGAK